MEECELVNICRTCLTEQGVFQSVFVPDDNCGSTIHLAEMIMAYASVQITFGDGLPDQICTECARQAVDFYLFKRKCEESDMVLRERLGKSPLCLDNTVVPPEDLYLKQDSVHIVVKPEINTEQVEYCTSESVEETVIEVQTEKTTPESDSELQMVTNVMVQYQCEVCLDIFDTEDALDHHKLTHDDFKNKYTCETCNKVFNCQETYIRHKLTHIIKVEGVNGTAKQYGTILLTEIIQNGDAIKEENNLKCLPCDVTFRKEDEMQLHKENTHKEDKTNLPIKCDVCQKKFSKSSHLTRHLKIHSAIRPHVCSLCNKSFARAEQLNNHLKVHSGVKPHVCKICSKGFNQISNLKDHMRTHNGEKPFLCSTCGKGFNQLGNLRQHTIRHSGIKAHLCSICGNGFASKGELCAHLRKHTGARPFVCPTCNHGFTTSSSLTKHKRIHSGEKPYECEVCKMRFSRSGILARHKRTHTGEKPYVCKYCSKAFSQSNDLSSHLRIHTGEKPFICDSCGQAFRQSSALKTHKKTHADRQTLFDSRAVINHMHNTYLSSIQ